MNKKVRAMVSIVLVLAVVALLAFPFVPAFASENDTAGNTEASIATQTTDNGDWEVTSLDISKDVDTVTASGAEISLEKTASESSIEMMVGETHDITFTISVDAALGNSFYIAGNIFVENTGDWPADVTAVSDTVWYKAGGPTWLPATSNITTTVPTGDNAIATGNHTYSYSGTFTLPVALSSVTAMSNFIEITISNHPGPHHTVESNTFKYRQDFAKPSQGGSTEVSLEDVETIAPASGLSYEIESVTINGSAASLTGPWALDLKDAPFTVVIDKKLTAEEAGEYVLNNKAIIGQLSDEVDVDIVVTEPERDKGIIEGHKWEDANGNSELDEGDIPVSGVTIELWKGGVLIDSKVTEDKSGHFAFYNLDPGEYLVKEILPDGWYAIYPVSVEAGIEEDETRYVDFLNARKAWVGGEKLNLADQAPIAGVKFVLEGDDYHKEVFSAEDGTFDFGWVMPGEYLLHEELPAGWVSVNGAERELVLKSGDEAHEVFVNKQLSVVYGYKWLDENGDGIHQESEPALFGVKVSLDAEGLHQEALTDENGYFIFKNLDEGQYVVSEEVPAGYYATGAVEEDFILGAGEEKRVDFINAPFASVGGTKWLDLNANGQIDKGEEGLSGVTIRLLDAKGDVIASEITAQDGSYLFEGLRAGAYTVEEIVPDGYVATAPVSFAFSLSPGEEKVYDFFNNVQVAGEIIAPPVEPAQPGAQETLPATGFELTYLLIMIGLLILLGSLIASLGLTRLNR